MVMQVQEIGAKANQERMLEADLMLASLADQRQLAAAAADEKVLLRKQQLHHARSDTLQQYILHFVLAALVIFVEYTHERL